MQTLLRDNQDFNDATVYLGRQFAWGGERLFGLRGPDRSQHTYIIGKSGTGKTSLLRNIIMQDIESGRGVGVIDPHGDLAIDLLDRVPRARTDDVVYFAPGDREFPIGFNILQGSGPEDRHLVSSGIVAAFKAVWSESWGPRMAYILGASIAALLECQNVTLLGLPRLLVDDDYRDWVLRQVKDPIVRSFFVDEYDRYDPRFRTEAIAPIQNKIGQLLMSPLLRNCLGQVRNRLDIRYIMDHRKIFIGNLSKGVLGEDKSNLLGALLVSQFQQAAMARATIAEKNRIDFHLLVDEFQNFTSDAFASILSESRKYKLALVLANQYLDQLPEGIAKAVFGNVGTMVSFRVGEKDAGILAREFGGHYDPDLFATLDNHHICVKLLTHGTYGDAFLGTTLPPLPIWHGRSANVIARSRERYGVARQQVEARIQRWLARQR